MKKSTSKKKSIIIDNAASNAQDGEEVEVVAQFILPQEGCWGWVVLISCFFCQFLVDGCALTYGTLLPDIVETIKIDASLAALVNSIEIALYFLFSPVSSAVINRLGFRTACMTGSMITCVGLYGSYFCQYFISLVVCLGVLTGIGASLISMSSSLIVGFYFQKRRSLALAIASGGSSVGIMAMYPMNNALVKRSGWKSTILLHAGLHGLIYFLSFTFRPLLSLTLTETVKDGKITKTVTYLPSRLKKTEQPGKTESRLSSAAEKLLRANSNKNFPTASAFFKEGALKTDVSASELPSTSLKALGISKKTLEARGSVSKHQLKLVQSMISKITVSETKNTLTEITIQAKDETPKSCCGKFLNWQSAPTDSRPMYRDDAFYTGSVKGLAIYQKSVSAIKEEERTGLEYQLAVSRAITADDLKERQGVFTMAVRRVLVSMMDPSLLERKSFLLFGLSGLFGYMGLLVPYVFIQDRNAQAGIDQIHCSLFVSVLSFSNLLGRLLFSFMADYFEPAYILAMGLLVAGLSTILSDMSYNVAYQYVYVIIFGAFGSVVSGVRSTVLVNLYGLENLTNATGIVLTFVGIGNLISTPLAAALKTKLGYNYAFYVAGGFITLSGVTFLPIKSLSKHENRVKVKEQKKVNISN